MKNRIIGLLHHAGVLACARRLQRHRSVVLTYHGVVTASPEHAAYLDDNFPDASVFEQQIAYISQHCRPIRLSELVWYYEHREAPPRGSIAVTFDDGFANNFTVAFPILRKYRIPFTVFLTTGLIGTPRAQLWTERVARAICLSARKSMSLRLGSQRDLLLRLDSQDERDDAARTIKNMLKSMPPIERDAAVAVIEDRCGRPPLTPEDAERYRFLAWSQIRAMADAGVEFGSHTVTHPMLSTLTPAEVTRELTDSKRRIEEEIQRECTAFAYPNGSPADFRPSDQIALQRAGYRCAFKNEGGLNGTAEDLYALKRINIVRRFDHAQFEAAISGMLHATSQLREAVRRLASEAPIPRTSHAS